MKQPNSDSTPVTDHYSRLATQSRGRPLSESESTLSNALIETFKGGDHDFSVVISRLNEANIARPSGAPGPWTVTNLEAELTELNRSLDQAYAENGIGG